MLIDEINIKLIILGHGGVGKTSLVNKYTKNEIPEMYIPSIGSNIVRKDYKIENQNIKIRINIWDVGGQRSFNPFNPVLFNNVDACFLVFDLSKPQETIKELKQFYLVNLTEHAQGSLSFIIGNKLDLISNRKQLKEIVEKYFDSELPLIFISAKTGENVNKLFDLFIYCFLDDWEKKFPDSKYKGLKNEFLNSIGKNEQELKKLFINPKTIDALKIRKKPTPDNIITKKHLRETSKANIGLGKYIQMQKQLEELDQIKEKIVEEFNKKLKIVENIIFDLKKTPIDLLLKTINETKDKLDEIKEDFQINLKSLLDLDKFVDKEKAK
ncbi:MAG: Rab family GTPase [Promethearchaeota archaeon]